MYPLIMGLLKNSELNAKRQPQSSNGHSRAGGNPANINMLLDARFHGHDESGPLRLMMKGFFNTPIIRGFKVVPSTKDLDLNRKASLVRGI